MFYINSSLVRPLTDEEINKIKEVKQKANEIIKTKRHELKKEIRYKCPECGENQYSIMSTQKSGIKSN